MAKFKLLEDVSVVWWAETIESKVEIDGEIVTFRYHENPKGTECYIWDDMKGWIQDYDDKFDCIFEICGNLEINKDSKGGEEFETETE
tara:strand:- start:448 stop:711 length:264 start_codon:yes stop_codon:yes gene_type:complete